MSAATSPDADLATALVLADLADSVSLPRFEAADLQVTNKPDMTPVSDADLAVEKAIRSYLETHVPDDAIVGEEYADHVGKRHKELKNYDVSLPGAHRASVGRCWVIDPIDGTKNFVRGVPIWATLIALLIDGIPTVGVVSAPAMARRWWGSEISGAWRSFSGGKPRPCRVSAVSTIDDASISVALPRAWEMVGRGEKVAEFSRNAWRTRGYGDFLSHMLVAQGAVDIAGEPELSLWDLAAIAPIVQAAGGQVSDTDGAPISATSTNLVATNGLLHRLAVTHLGQ